MNKKLKVVIEGKPVHGVFISLFSLTDLFLIKAKNKEKQENEIFNFLYKNRNKKIRKTIILELLGGETK